MKNTTNTVARICSLNSLQRPFLEGWGWGWGVAVVVVVVFTLSSCLLSGGGENDVGKHIVQRFFKS